MPSHDREHAFSATTGVSTAILAHGNGRVTRSPPAAETEELLGYAINSQGAIIDRITGANR